MALGFGSCAGAVLHCLWQVWIRILVQRHNKTIWLASGKCHVAALDSRVLCAFLSYFDYVFLCGRVRVTL
jgi:hypothetical protein